MSRQTLSFYVWVQVLFICLNLTPAVTLAGQEPRTDSIPKRSLSISKDSLLSEAGTQVKKNVSAHITRAKNIPGALMQKPGRLKKLLPDSISLKKQLALSFETKKPLLRFDGGMVNYNLWYRTNMDTPYLEKNISQHAVTGNLQFTIANQYPVRIIYLGRKSNSIYFRDIYDVRVEFNANLFKDRLTSGLQKKLSNQLNQLRDSLTPKIHLDKEAELNKLKAWLRDPFTEQRLIQMNEIIRIPALSYDVTLPDSLARKRSDSIRTQAQAFMKMYNEKKAQYDALAGKVDSLKSQYYSTLMRFNRLKEMLRGNFNNWRQFREWKDDIQDMSGEKLSIPKKYEWLMGIRNFSLGKSPVSYSELTAKNISINGLNFEYNSWYYFAITAGLVDYRFRDFSLQPFRRSPQYLYMVRLGIGELQKNYFIVSAFRGQKQLYRSGSNNGAASYTVNGLAIEGKYQLSRNAYVIAEAAQSVAPSFNTNPPADNKFWDLSDNRSKAYSVKIFSYFPRTASRVEGMYKYTGANYQSFNSFQSNSALSAWYFKAAQNFFKRQLRITVSARSNEFYNPYIVQAYSSNTVFKSVQASFRKRRWPTIGLGYLPVSQLTKIDNQVYENRFQTLNASLNHIYKLGVRQATTFVFTRFYNKQTDTSFAYFNASNFIITQNIFFSDFSALVGISQMRNNAYVLNVLEGSFDIPLNRNVSIGAGSKVNSLNRSHVRVGYSGKLNIRFAGQDFLYFYFEKGYLSGRKDELVRNDLINAGFIKHF